MPVYYECQRCTACCRWPGDVNVDPPETKALASFLGLEEYEFIQRHTRLRHNRQGLSLMEKPNGECVFLKERDCSVQPVKPKQCRDFPNRWNFPGFDQQCQAVPVELSEAQYRERIHAPVPS